MGEEQKDIIYFGVIDSSLMRRNEDINQSIIRMMEEEGLKIPEHIEIQYDGTIDEGIGDSQQIPFQVYSIKNKKEEKEEILEELNELKEIRNLLLSLGNDVENYHIIEELEDKVLSIKDQFKNPKMASDELKKELQDIDQELIDVKNNIDNYSKQYDEIYQKMNQIIEDTKNQLNGDSLLDSNEIEKIQNLSLGKKMEENSQSIYIKNKLDLFQKKYHLLKDKEKKLLQDIESAEAFDLTISEYQEIYKSFPKTKLFNRILREKGLNFILDKPSNERTKEEKEILKNAKNSILEDIRKRRLDDKTSILDIVVSMYHLDDVMKKKELSKPLRIPSKAMQNIERNQEKLPKQIMAKQEDLNSYIPLKAPDDILLLNAGKQDEIKLLNSAHIEKEEEKGKEILEKIKVYQDTNTNQYYVNQAVLNRFMLDKDLGTERIDGKLCYQITEEDKDAILNNVNEETTATYYQTELIPVSLESTKAEDIENKNSSLQKDEESLSRAIKEDVITLYKSIDNPNQIYISKDTLSRFDIGTTSHEVIIDNEICYPMKESIYNFMNYKLRQNPNISVEYRSFTSKNEMDSNNYDNRDIEEVISKVEENINRIEEESSDFKENSISKEKEKTSFFEDENEDIEEKEENDQPIVISLYEDLDANKVFVEKKVLNTFDIEVHTKPIVISGITCQRVNDVVVRKLEEMADSSNSQVVIKHVALRKKKKEKKVKEPLQEEGIPNSTIDNITVEEKKNDKDEEEPLVEEKISSNKNEPLKKEEEIETTFSDQDETVINDSRKDDRDLISDDELESIINSRFDDLEKEELNDNLNHEEEKEDDLKLNKVENSFPKPHVEAILYKLTKDLNIHKKDSKRFQASNIKVSKRFVNELKSGNYLYNIVHIVPSVGKATIGFFQKLSSKLLLTKRAKESIIELRRRTYEDLTDEELEVLFHEYRGNQLKTDMNNQINPIILDRLKDYGMRKVRLLNESIQNNYRLLFTCLGEIDALDEEIEDGKLFLEDKKKYVLEKEEILSTCKDAVLCILKDREEANNLLSGGIHGLEEDFKAVQTKLSYAGMRFAKDKDFNNDLQSVLAEYGQALNNAISMDDKKGIVDNFIKLESCYFNNTDIDSSMFGKRSVGAKYYSPLAEEFDYRDDPFIRDLFTTVAITSATVSAINAYRVHQIEDRQLLNQQRDDAYIVNQNNDNIVDFSHQVANKIDENRDVITNGIKAQASEDILSVGHILNQKNVALNSNLTGTNIYHHIQGDINKIISEYSSGTLNDVQVLAQLKNVVRDSQGYLNTVASDYLKAVQEYASAHPGFDISALQDTLEQIVYNPSAIMDMNEAIFDITNMAGGLSSLTTTHVEALSYLPSDMITTLTSAIASCSLAIKVSSTMNQKYHKKNIYGNDVTDLMDRYLNGEEFEDEEVDENHQSRRH